MREARAYALYVRGEAALRTVREAEAALRTVREAEAALLAVRLYERRKPSKTRSHMYMCERPLALFRTCRSKKRATATGEPLRDRSENPDRHVRRTSRTASSLSKTKLNWILSFEDGVTGGKPHKAKGHGHGATRPHSQLWRKHNHTHKTKRTRAPGAPVSSQTPPPR